MKLHVLLFTMLIILLNNMQAKSQQSDANERLFEVFRSYDEYGRRNYPEWATYDGDNRYDDKVTDNSEGAILSRYDSLRNFLKMVEEIDYDELTEANKLNYQLFRMDMEESLQNSRFMDYLMPMGQQFGIHIDLPQLVQSQPLGTADEFNKYFARLRKTQMQVGNVIDLMRKGVKMNLVMPDFIMEKTIPQIASLISKNPEESVFYEAMKKGENLTAEERESISNELKEIIAHDINPAFQELHDFVRDEYIPSCRKEAGIWAMPDGGERYDNLVRSYTTLGISFHDVHNTGLREVERIKKEMASVKDMIGFNGTVSEFNEHLRNDPAMYFSDKQDLLDGYAEILERMNTRLSMLFGRLPEARCELKEIEEFRAKSAPMAYYYSASEDRSRPGYFYVNTYDISSRPKYSMTALTLHEAVPGHHMQISIAQEIKDMPKFRRDGGYTAFVEGWALYAESLGYESGMYEELYQRYGALIFEMWRACRLVVDTGIHGMGWSRQQAIDYMTEHTANSRLDIESEVDRYIAWPGQALSYKIGELKIKELRKKAEESLGGKFDIKKFHDHLLVNGALPLPILEKVVEKWISDNI